MNGQEVLFYDGAEQAIDSAILQSGNGFKQVADEKHREQVADSINNANRRGRMV